MDGKQLRNSILQWAIQGKLVPQEPNDESASVLLERIREEKARLVKEKKIKRDKNESIIYRGEDNSYYEKFIATGEVKCIDDEITFEIPDSWVWTRINNVCTITNGFTPLRTNDSFWRDGTINWFTVEDIREQGDVIHYTKQKISKTATTPERIVRAGSTLLCCTASVGTCAITRIPLTTNQQFNALTTKEEFNHFLNDEYLYLYARTLEDELHRLAGKTTFEFVSVKKVGNILIAIPPLEEQHRICNRIERIIPFITRYNQSNDLLNDLNSRIKPLLRKSILQEAIQGKLVEQDPDDEPVSVLLERIKQEKERLIKEKKIKRDKQGSTIYRGDDNKYYENLNGEIIDITDQIPYDLPQSWRWVRLRDIGNWGAGATPNRSNLDYYNNGTIPWIKTGELNNGIVTDSIENVTPKALEECSLRIVNVGDVLIAMYGATIGKLAIAGIQLTTNQACCACTPFGGIYNWYLFYYLMANKETLLEMGAGGAQPNISREKIVQFLFALPPENEQHRIVSKIKKLIQTIS